MLEGQMELNWWRRPAPGLGVGLVEPIVCTGGGHPQEEARAQGQGRAGPGGRVPGGVSW